MKDYFLIKYNKTHMLDVIAETEPTWIAVTLILIDIPNRDQIRNLRTKNRDDNVSFEIYAMFDTKEGYKEMRNICANQRWTIRLALVWTR